MKKTLLLCAFILCLFLGSAFMASADTGLSDTQTHESKESPYTAHGILIFTEPQLMDKPRNNLSFWFAIPEGTELGDASTLSLSISTTDTLINEHSSATVILNNVELESTPILSIVDNNRQGVWSIPLPAKHLKTDGSLNEIQVVTAQRSILGDCADIDNPANWVKLEDSSRLYLDIKQTPSPKLYHTLPYFFNQLKDTHESNAEFILPDNPDETLLSALLTSSSAIGAAYPNKESVNFTLSYGKAAGNLPNQIFIGLNNQFPQSSFTLPALSAENGYLAVTQENEYNQLLIAGADAKGLQKSLCFLQQPVYLSQLSGTSSIIATELKEEVKAFSAQEDGYYTLSDFGYDTVHLKGAFHQQTSFRIKQPEGIRSGSGSYLELHFRHAKTLLADSSLLTVLINDVQVNSIQLSDSNAETGKIKAKIPAEALEQEIWDIKIETYHSLGKIDCSKDYSDTAWTVLDKNSVLYFEPNSIMIAPTLRSFPIFNVPSDKVKSSAVLFSAPKEASVPLLETALKLSYRGGQHTGAAYSWSYTPDLNTVKDKTNSDIIVMGSNPNVVIPAEIAEKLLIIPQEENQFALADSAPVTQEALQDKILLQVIRSPWNFSRKVYVITYPSSMEGALNQQLTQKHILNQLTAPAAMIDQTGKVTLIKDSPSKSADTVPFSAGRLVGKIVRVTGISRTGLIIILLCIIVIVILIIRAVSNRHRFTQAKQKMEKINADTLDDSEEKS